jgi:hypothetical protein
VAKRRPSKKAPKGPAKRKAPKAPPKAKKPSRGKPRAPKVSKAEYRRRYLKGLRTREANRAIAEAKTAKKRAAALTGWGRIRARAAGQGAHILVEDLVQMIINDAGADWALELGDADTYNWRPGPATARADDGKFTEGPTTPRKARKVMVTRGEQQFDLGGDPIPLDVFVETWVEWVESSTGDAYELPPVRCLIMVHATDESGQFAWRSVSSADNFGVAINQAQTFIQAAKGQAMEGSKNIHGIDGVRFILWTAD